MYELTVVGFKKDMFRASAVLNKLIDLDVEWTIDLRDAIAVYRDYSGRLRVDQSYPYPYTYPTTGTGAVLGGLWGSLIGALLAAPFTAGASAAVAGGAVVAGLVGGGALGAIGGDVVEEMDAEYWWNEAGIADTFLAEVGHMIEPGDSAIFALLRTSNPDYVAEQFRGYGGTVLRTSLTQEQADKMQAVLDSQEKA
jgi:uncharacterized membrane protein